MLVFMFTLTRQSIAIDRWWGFVEVKNKFFAVSIRSTKRKRERKREKEQKRVHNAGSGKREIVMDTLIRMAM